MAQATPTIWNSDQGSQFTSPQYLDRLRQAQVQISMDGKGRALDNIFTERCPCPQPSAEVGRCVWRTVKYEEVYLQDYAQPKEAGHQIALYFDFYNHRRSHQSLNYQTPAQVYFVQEVRPH